MKTLLDKVQHVEQEAAAIIAAAEKTGKQAIADIVDVEEEVLAEIKERAEKKGEKIIKERVQKAQDEVNRVHQDDSLSTSMVHEAAEKNKEMALKRAWQIFKDEYLQG